MGRFGGDSLKTIECNLCLLRKQVDDEDRDLDGGKDSMRGVKSGKNRRPTISQSTLYVKWKPSQHAIYTHYQALALLSDGPDLKVESIHRTDSVYLLMDAARYALSKEEFKEFQNDIKKNMGDGDNAPRYCLDNDFRFRRLANADFNFANSARTCRF